MAVRRQRGISLVEMLVGITVGLFVVVGAAKLLVDYLINSRQVLLETRVNQDLRVAADVVVRDLRRAGYWSNSLSGATWPAATNPFRGVTPTGVNVATTATYSYESGAIAGFRLGSATVSGQPVGVIEAHVGGVTWQQLTDPTSVNITQFDVTPNIQTVSLGTYCTPVCALGSPGCPTINVRRYDVVISGTAVSDSRVQRQLRERVRVRNDEIPTPSCP